MRMVFVPLLGRTIGAPARGSWQAGRGYPTVPQPYVRLYGDPEHNRSNKYRDWVRRSIVERSKAGLSAEAAQYAHIVLNECSDDECRPMWSRLAYRAGKAGVSMATARRHERELEAHGLLQRWHRKAKYDASTGGFRPQTNWTQFFALPEVLANANKAMRENRKAKQMPPHRVRSVPAGEQQRRDVAEDRAKASDAVAESLAEFYDPPEPAEGSPLVAKAAALRARSRGST